MTTPSSHEGYRRIARRALRGPDSIVAKTDWEVFLHGFCDTNQLGDSRRIYDCLIDLFPTPEAVLRWPVYDPNTGEKFELPETGGCQNFRSRVNAGQWLRDNAENWEGIRRYLRCDTPEKKRAARDFRGRKTRNYMGSLNRRLSEQVQGAGLKGADMHLLWGGCEVPVIDIQLVRYMAPHVLGIDYREHSRQQLILWKKAGNPIDLDPDRPAAERRIVQAEDIQTDETDPDQPDATMHISAMEKSEISKIQNNVTDYHRWREAAYQMAEAEGIPVNQWHVATWLESRAGGDPDRKGRRSMALIAEDDLRLARTQEFTARTFGPTDFPEVPASWPLPAERYPRRERRKRLAQMRSDGVSRAEMAEREGVSRKTVASDLDFYDLQQSRLPEIPEAWYHHRSAEIDEQIDRGLVQMGTAEVVTDPKTSELISEEEAISRLHYTPRPNPRTVPGDPAWFYDAFSGSEEAKHLAGVDQAMKDISSTIREEGRLAWLNTKARGGQAEYDADARVEELYGRFLDDPHDYYGPVRGIAGRTRFPILQEQGLLPDKIQGYAGLANVRDKLADRKRHLENEDEELLKAIMQAEEEMVGLGLSLPEFPGSETPSDMAPTVREVWERLEKEAFSRLMALETYRDRRDLSVREIAKMYGITHVTLYGWIREAGVPLRRPRKPSAFVGFETPFGFDDNIRVMWQDWVQYKIDDTPVIVKRVKAKPGTKVNPRYKGATAPQELEIDFRLRATNRKDMQKIDFLLERLREDNPTMTVRVNVKTNGQVAHRNLPSWQERPYRLEPAMYIGYQSPDEYDSNIQSFRWEHTVPHPDMEDHALITTTNQTESVPTIEVEHLLGLQRGNPLGLDEQEREEYKAEYFKQSDSTNAYYELDGVHVDVRYGSYTLGYNAIDPAVEMESINNAATVSIQRGRDTKADISTFRMIGKFLDRIKEENPGIRLFAEAKGDPVTIMDAPGEPDVQSMPDDEFDAALAEAEAQSRKDIRARVYGRYGWERLYEMEGEDRGGWAMEYKPSPSAPSAFAGIERYADAIMELV
jgi:hypothetical protein